MNLAAAISQLTQTGRAIIVTPDIGDCHAGQQIKVGNQLATVAHIARGQLGGDWELTFEIAKPTKREDKKMGLRKGTGGYEINGKVFSTKQAAREEIREILYRYVPEERLIGEDYDFIADLLTNHQCYEEKVGCGLVAICVGCHCRRRFG